MASVGGYDLSTYEGRQAARDANPGAIVDASSIYYPSTGQQVGGAAPTVQASASSSQLSSGINSLLGAIASGNKQAFDEAVRQFNLTFGLDQSKFNESVRQFNENEAISQAGLTGTYQGQQTQQAQLQAANIANQAAGLTGTYNPYTAGYSPGSYIRDPSTGAIYAVGQGGNLTWISDPSLITPGAQSINVPGATQFANANMQTQQAQQQAFQQQLDAINAAAQLQANPFRQQQVIGQLGRILGGQGVAGFSAPNTVQGVGTAGGTGPNTGMAYMSQLISDIQNPGANQASVNSVFEGIPTPNKINSADFLRAAPSTQNMILQGMQEKYGLDPNDSLQQIKNTLPSFNAPTTFGKIQG